MILTINTQSIIMAKGYSVYINEDQETTKNRTTAGGSDRGYLGCFKICCITLAAGCGLTFLAVIGFTAGVGLLTLVYVHSEMNLWHKVLFFRNVHAKGVNFDFRPHFSHQTLYFQSR